MAKTMIGSILGELLPIGFTNALVELSDLLAAKDARIKELETENVRLTRFGFYPFAKHFKPDEEPGEWNEIKGPTNCAWRYVTRYGILCCEIRQPIWRSGKYDPDKFQIIEIPVEMVRRIGDLHGGPREHILHWADMLHNPD